ncbi:TetR/AcrR family transcriptional regulator [Streptomyces thermoviolaceus]|uniref:ScbR family autoregulator-binding transcription factor n=1 Tax=Streptomyces thermoviolaceus TaxID=1952 RepID=UPI00203ED152|nr:ScbR family autoregulator-binding transcription factor [Streptomyces thermoviolaceus]MCM3265203.1 TetR/AcrR family transcriptional regulator [Streptomyces thermoviolaceus]
MPEARPAIPVFTQKKIVTRRGPHPKQDRSARTRQLVLAAAAELFARQGFRRTSIQAVADRVRMTKGAVYFHYPSKEALAVAVVEEHYARWPRLLKEVSAEGFGPMDTVVHLLARAARAFRDDSVVQAGARLQIERPQIDAELPTPYVDWTDLLTSLLTSAHEAGELRREVTPEAAARSLVAAFFGAQHISDVLHGRTDVVERWAEVGGLLYHAIRAR